MSRNTPSYQGLSPDNQLEVINHGDDHSLTRNATARPSVWQNKANVSRHNAKRTTRQANGRVTDDDSVDGDDNANEEDCSTEEDATDEESEKAAAFPQFDANLRQMWRKSSGASESATTSRKSTVSQTDRSALLSDTETSDTAFTAFPRQKTQRRLSNNNGLFTYDAVITEGNMDALGTAVTDDEDDYAGVDLISNDESDGEVERREQIAIADDESDNDSDDSLFDYGVNQELAEGGYFDEQMELMPEDPNLDLFRLASPLPSASNRRRVRFQEVEDIDVVAELGSFHSDTSSDTVDIPDLFTQMPKQFPGFPTTPVDTSRAFNSPFSSDQSSYWEFEEEEEEEDYGRSTAASFVAASDAGDAILGAESGYDSDASGDTTEEDVSAPPPSVTPKATLRSYKSPARRAARQRRGRISRSLPRIGTFRVDPDKVYGYFRKGVGVVMCPPSNRKKSLTRTWPGGSVTSTALSSPVTPYQGFVEDSDMSDANPRAVLHSQGPVSDVMLGGLFGMPPDQALRFGGQIIAPPEYFFPPGNASRTSDAFAPWDEESSAADAASSEDLNSIIRLDDIIEGDFDDGVDDEMNMSTFPDDTGAESEFFEPTSPTYTESSSAMTPFRSYSNSFAGGTAPYSVNTGLVNSFRSNQDRAKHLSRMPNERTGYVPTSTSSAIRNGFSADSFMTPIRKRKSSKDDAVFKTPMRKMSGDRVGKSFSPNSNRKLPSRGFFS